MAADKLRIIRWLIRGNNLNEGIVMNTNLKKQKGQGLSEYIIIVALIAIAAIGVVGKFGGVVTNQIAAMATEMGGGDGSTKNQAATQLGNSAAGGEKTLADYTDNAGGSAGGGAGSGNGGS